MSPPVNPLTPQTVQRLAFIRTYACCFAPGDAGELIRESECDRIVRVKKGPYFGTEFVCE
ncbi:hypothetical protein GCM10011583_66250 [Streptomyces camponoticapitis]|uniref:Uncharacterized protein n=1 Tax=Streptomyces camponoticapitis TaxID=1616125 RepID=A0ABQ2ET16_9ACTN|nr:hypothetical protein GCM10011583_66250 [Streptomyces camponoticapitis]